MTACVVQMHPARGGVPKIPFPVAPRETVPTEGPGPLCVRIGRTFRIGKEVAASITKVRKPAQTITAQGDRFGKELFAAEAKAGNVAAPLCRRGLSLLAIRFTSGKAGGAGMPPGTTVPVRAMNIRYHCCGTAE